MFDSHDFFRRVDWFYLACASPVLVMIACGLVVVVGFVPRFEPYDFRGLDVVPTEVCVGQQVRITVDRSIATDWRLREKDAYEFESYWVNEETGEDYEVDSGFLDVDSGEEGEVVSPQPRGTPPEPGVMTFHNDAWLHGFVWITAREQKIGMVAPNTTSVLPYDSPRCDELRENPAVIRASVDVHGEVSP